MSPSFVPRAGASSKVSESPARSETPWLYTMGWPTQPKGTGSFRKRGELLQSARVLSKVAYRYRSREPGLFNEVIALLRQQSCQSISQSVPQPAQGFRSITVLNL